MKHLEQHQILADHQRGFHAKRSTETQLIHTINDKRKSLDNKESVDMAILDLCKGFLVASLIVKVLFGLNFMSQVSCHISSSNNSFCRREVSSSVLSGLYKRPAALTND